MPHNSCYEFGPFQLDLYKHVLTRSGVVISLTPKATEILVMLVTNAGQLVKKDELLKEVWPDTFVEESNLSQNIFTLRKALGDDRRAPRYIETVVRRGYRFVAAVKVQGIDKQQVESSRLTLAGSITNHQVLAVLPFLNDTENAELEYLTDGITGNLINNLSRVSKLHVMSHSAISMFKTALVAPRQVAKELGATVVLVGALSLRSAGITITAELVEVSTGWQLWGESFCSETKDLLEIQDTIARRVLAALGMSLTGDEEQQVTVRYTENAKAYDSYLEGRFHWSLYTRKSIEKAICHFQNAIERDPNYALAYAGIVDCFLRLATDYLPPEDILPADGNPRSDVGASNRSSESEPRIKVRFEWDWKGAERELRRANELRTGYPCAYQWHAAYKATKQLYEQCSVVNHANRFKPDPEQPFGFATSTQFEFLELTPNEEAQVYCTIAREQMDIGNYKAACRVLRPWWSFGVWPKLNGLNQPSCADLLLTVGELAGCVASTNQLPRGQKHTEELLNSSIALFEQLGIRRRAAEGRIELALCYYRQGLFDVGRTTLIRVLDEITDECWELRSLAVIRLATLERHAGRPREALTRLSEAIRAAESCGPWATGRCNLELASSYKELAVTEGLVDNFHEATLFYSRALYEFESIGNHRLAAITENNLGVVMLLIGNFREAESHLRRARKTFDSFEDKIRCAQVDESLAQLYCAQGRFDDADLSIQLAIKTMESGDEDALLTEALTTKGLIYCKLKRYGQAKIFLENAYRLAQRCGDMEGAGRALAVLVEEMRETVDAEERSDVSRRIVEITSHSKDLSIHNRLQKCLAILAETNSVL